MILSGAPITAQEGKACGLIDEVVQGDLRAVGLAFCQNLIDSGAGPRPTREMQTNAEGFDAPGSAAVLRTHSRTLRGRTTQTLAIEAITAAMQSFDEGIAVEARLAAQSLTSRESQALRHMFFADRQSGKVKGEAKAAAPAPIRQAAVIGAGTMGSGIALAFADAGVAVTLIDSTEAGLARGQDMVRSNYAASVKRGRISPAAAEERIQRVTGSLRLEDAATADVVVEAVFEDLELKQDVLSRLDAILPPDRLIASNTSTLSVTGVGRATAHPDRVAGLYFFSADSVLQ
jgi:3-hydroxyacyl-CoA dehydrogenase